MGEIMLLLHHHNNVLKEVLTFFFSYHKHLITLLDRGGNGYPMKLSNSLKVTHLRRLTGVWI